MSSCGDADHFWREPPCPSLGVGYTGNRFDPESQLGMTFHSKQVQAEKNQQAQVSHARLHEDGDLEALGDTRSELDSSLHLHGTLRVQVLGIIPSLGSFLNHSLPIATASIPFVKPVEPLKTWKLTAVLGSAPHACTAF